MKYGIVALIAFLSFGANARCYDIEYDNISMKGTVIKVTTVISNDEEVTAWVMEPLKSLCIVENGNQTSPTKVIVVPSHRMKTTDEYALTVGDQWEVRGSTWPLGDQPDGISTAITFTGWNMLDD